MAALATRPRLLHDEVKFCDSQSTHIRSSAVSQCHFDYAPMRFLTRRLQFAVLPEADQYISESGMFLGILYLRLGIGSHNSLSSIHTGNWIHDTDILHCLVDKTPDDKL